MTTTLANLLAGVDMEGGENFCDSVYNFLKNQGKDINLITNSGFGVWSQSDANKGLAALVFDNGTVAPVVGETIAGANATGKIIWVDVTDDDWAGNNGAGTAYLGAVSGAYIDNETIAGSAAASFDVNGDLNIGVKNDPMNDDSVAAVWTDEGGNITLAHLVAEYSVTTLAINQHAWIVAAPLTAGKIYKIELDIKDGNVTDDIQGYFFDGAAQYGRLRTTAAGWVSVAWVFECATTTAAGLVGFRIPANLGGGNTIEIRRFSCYEITPCCTESGTLAFDGWCKAAEVDIYRQHNDGGTYTYDGSFYALKIVPTIATHFVDFPSLGAPATNEEWYQQFAGRPVTYGAWVMTSTALHARIRLYDGGYINSSYHTGGGGWEWLEVTDVVSSTVTTFFSIIVADAAPNVDGSTIVYISQPMMVFGWSLGENMYQPRLQEEVLCEKAIPSNLLDALLSQDDIAVANLNVEADSDAMLPKGCKKVKILTQCNDVNSHNTDCYLRFRADAIKDYEYYNSPYGLTADSDNRILGWQQCDVYGDVDYNLESSGAGNFDIDFCYYVAVRVN